MIPAGSSASSALVVRAMSHTGHRSRVPSHRLVTPLEVRTIRVCHPKANPSRLPERGGDGKLEDGSLRIRNQAGELREEKRASINGEEAR